MQLYESLIGSVSEQIRYTAAPIHEILHNMSNENEWLASLSVIKDSTDWKDELLCFLQKDALLNGLREDDRILLNEWVDGLGKSDLQGQIDHCSRYRHKINNSATEAKQDAQIKGKLYTTLGITAGFVITLMWL